MPVVRHPGQLPAHREQGWLRQTWAGAAVFGVPVPMTAHRYTVDPGAGVPHLPVAGPETLACVTSGSGTARAGGEQFTLARESVLWLAGCAGLAVEAGRGGLDVLVAESAGGAGRPPATPRPPTTTPAVTTCSACWRARGCCTAAGRRCGWAPAS